ncbi:MAG: hypothetical protein B6229_00310 [Spirochaetaceae bacterium 4572_7]|nr:MAG: hypothetical protein B6229_00310 [Spirochaetaceae bacterium 4572_7]
MPTVKELEKEIEKEKAKIERRERKETLEKELFNLRHKRKLELLKRLKETTIHMGKNAGAMVKKAEKRSKKKRKRKKNISPFGFEY